MARGLLSEVVAEPRPTLPLPLPALSEAKLAGVGPGGLTDP